MVTDQIKAVSLIGVKSDLGASVSGAAHGANAIRQAGLKAQLNQLGLKVNDYGNINADNVTNLVFDNKTDTKGNTLKNLIPINSVNTKLYHLTTQALQKNEIPIVLGGDHSLSAGSIMAVSDHYKKIGIIWVDAHGDFNNEQSSPSGNIHGMALSALTGGGPNLLLPFKRGEFCAPQNTVIIGARALDNEEKLRLKNAGVTVFTMHHVDTLGIAQVAKKAIHIALNGTNGMYLSFDLDAFDPSIMPTVGTAEEGGLTFREGRLLLEYIAKTQKLLGLDMVELNPKVDYKAGYADIDDMQRAVEIGHSVAKRDKSECLNAELIELNPIGQSKKLEVATFAASNSALIAAKMISFALGKTLD